MDKEKAQFQQINGSTIFNCVKCKIKSYKNIYSFFSSKNSNYANIYIAYFYIWRCIWYICYKVYNVNIVIKLTSPLGLSSPWPSFSVNGIIFMLATYRWGPMRKHSVQTLEWSHLSLNMRCRHHRHYRHNHLHCVVLEREGLGGTTS